MAGTFDHLLEDNTKKGTFDDLLDSAKSPSTQPSQSPSLPPLGEAVVRGPVQTSRSGRTGHVDTVTGPRMAIDQPSILPSPVDGAQSFKYPSQQPSQQPLDTATADGDGYLTRSYNYATGVPDQDPTLLGQAGKGFISGVKSIGEHPASLAASLVAPELTLGGALIAGMAGATGEFIDSYLRGDENPAGNSIASGILNGMFHGIGGIGKNIYKNTISKAADEIAEYPAKMKKYNEESALVKNINAENKAKYEELATKAVNDSKDIPTSSPSEAYNIKRNNFIKQAKIDLIKSDPKYANYAEYPDIISDEKALAHLKEMKSEIPLPEYPLNPKGVDITQVLGPASRYGYKAATKVLPEKMSDRLTGALEYNKSVPKFGKFITNGLAGEGKAKALKPMFNKIGHASGVAPILVRGMAIPGIISDPESHD